MHTYTDGNHVPSVNHLGASCCSSSTAQGYLIIWESAASPQNTYEPPFVGQVFKPQFASFLPVTTPACSPALSSQSREQYFCFEDLYLLHWLVFLQVLSLLCSFSLPTNELQSSAPKEKLNLCWSSLNLGLLSPAFLGCVSSCRIPESRLFSSLSLPGSWSKLPSFLPWILLLYFKIQNCV